MLGYRKTWLIAGMVVFAGLFASPLVVTAAKNDEGTIKGKVNYCGKGGYVGMQVFIPGRQFSVFLGQDGDFVFEHVPVGSYEINYVINGRLVNANKNIPVSAGGTNNLGEIVFCDEASSEPAQGTTEKPQQSQLSCESNPQQPECLDADNDGVIAAKDCNDNNPDVRPGAIERCDGVDNNCNGEIDELLSVDINNGVGFCANGKVSVKSCRKGFDDCDKDPANGCETDIFNDGENCGACGNACSGEHVCALGMC